MTILYQFLYRDEDIYISRSAAEIIKHYGLDHQGHKLAEECAELLAAAARCNADTNPDAEHAEHYLEELADVILVLEQIIGSMPAKVGRRLAEIVMTKADRQLRRMSQEKEREAARDIGHGC